MTIVFQQHIHNRLNVWIAFVSAAAAAAAVFGLFAFCVINPNRRAMHFHFYFAPSAASEEQQKHTDNQEGLGMRCSALARLADTVHENEQWNAATSIGLQYALDTLFIYRVLKASQVPGIVHVVFAD